MKSKESNGKYEKVRKSMECMESKESRFYTIMV